MTTYGGDLKALTIRNQHYKLLDHGYVQLIDFMGDDLTPLASARMSTGKETGVDEDADDHLRERLWRDGHTSPFESCEMIVELQLPIFCLRQIDRHRTLKYDDAQIETVDPTMREFSTRNEYSGRYATMPDLHYCPALTRIKGKNPSNKQGSGELLGEQSRFYAVKLVQDTTAKSRESYEALVGMGVASEVARLPITLNQYTKVRLKACLLNWFKFLDLRLRPDVQWETRCYAQAIGKIIMALWPKTWDVFEEHTLYGTRLSRTERAFLKRALEVYQRAPERTAALNAGSKFVEPGIEALLVKLTTPSDLLETEAP